MATSPAKTPPRTEQKFVLGLPVELHRELQDWSIRETRRVGRKIPMTEIARNAIEREIRRLERQRT